MAITACGVTVERPDGDVEYLSAAEFRRHVESVFRRHNAAQDRLISRLVALRGEAPEAHARLARAESEMLDACSGLESVANRPPRTGLGLFQRRSLSAEVAACERAVTRVEAELAGPGAGAVRPRPPAGPAGTAPRGGPAVPP